MKNVSKMMLVVWPNGIPTSEYDKAAALVSGMVTDEKQQKKPAGRRPSSVNVDRVKSILSTGPATAKEIAEALNLSVYAVKTALEKCGTVAGTRANANGFGLPANVYVLRKGA